MAGRIVIAGGRSAIPPTAQPVGRGVGRPAARTMIPRHIVAPAPEEPSEAMADVGAPDRRHVVILKTSGRGVPITGDDILYGFRKDGLGADVPVVQVVALSEGATVLMAEFKESEVAGVIYPQEG